MNQFRGNLSEEPNSFVGRERELAEVCKLAHASRALTLCGPGGVGKTRLAMRLLAELSGDFPDGTWVVELADLGQPDLVVSRIASVIGVAEEPGRPLLETLADALRPRPPRPAARRRTWRRRLAPGPSASWTGRRASARTTPSACGPRAPG